MKNIKLYGYKFNDENPHGRTSCQSIAEYEKKSKESYTKARNKRKNKKS